MKGIWLPTGNAKTPVFFLSCFYANRKSSRSEFLNDLCKLEKKHIFVFIKFITNQCRLGFGHFKSALTYFVSLWDDWLSQLEQNLKGNAVVGNIWCGHEDVGFRSSHIW